MRAYLELLLATVFWGFAFVGAVWAFDGVGPIWLTSIRFVIAVVAIDLFYRLRLFGLKPIQYRLKDFLAIAPPGVFLFAALALQTCGLKITTPSKSGFITVLYVLFIPIFERIFLRFPIRKILWLWITLALTGTAMICGAITEDGISTDFASAFNFGDFLTFLCAIASAAHLIASAKLVGQKPQSTEQQPVGAEKHEEISPVLFHLYQSIWIALFAGVLGSFMEGFSWAHSLINGGWNVKVWAGVLEMGLLSSGVAFLILVRGQRTVPPSTAGMIILMESPWAMVFSVWILSEKLTTFQVMGALLILAAAVAESITQMRVERRKGLTEAK